MDDSIGNAGRHGRMKDLWNLFVIFFKAGTFTFAGGLAMLPVIEKSIVDTHKMMSREDFLESATLAQTLPGVIALNCASFVGRHVAGTPGMLAAGFGSIFSAFVIMIGATVLLQAVPQSGPVAGAFHGIRAASGALVLSAAFTLGRHNLKNMFSVILMLAAFTCVGFLNIGAPVVVLGAGVAGWLYSSFRNHSQRSSDDAR